MPSETKSTSATMTKAFAEKLAKKTALKKPLICLYGDLGAGKTTFVKGFARALGIREKSVKSPTFIIHQTYRKKEKTVHHLDCYRIQKSAELKENLEELLRRNEGPIIIEWADRVQDMLPEKRIDIFFRHLSPRERNITVYGLHSNT